MVMVILSPPSLHSVTYYNILFTGIINFNTKWKHAKEFCAVKEPAELWKQTK
jgi:hypothetical protein